MTKLSGRPGSNRPPEAWKATALPNELLPLLIMLNVVCWILNYSIQNSTFKIQNLEFKILKNCGQEWIRTTEVERQRIYSPPHLATLEPAPVKNKTKNGNVNLPEPLVGVEPTTYWLQISCSTNWAKVAYLSKNWYQFIHLRSTPTTSQDVLSWS